MEEQVGTSHVSALEESSGTLSISSYANEPHDLCSLAVEQFSEFLNDDMADVGCSESKSRLDRHHILMNMLNFQHQHTDKLCRQVMSCAELFNVKIAECIAKFESYHSEFVSLQQHVRNSCDGQTVWCEPFK